MKYINEKGKIIKEQTYKFLPAANKKAFKPYVPEEIEVPEVLKEKRGRKPKNEENEG